jgi:hypothetical protein
LSIVKKGGPCPRRPPSDKIAAEFAKAYLDVDVGHITTKKITDCMTEDQYKTIIAANTSHKKKDVKLYDDSLVGVDLPKQGAMNAAQYRVALRSFTYTKYWKPVIHPLGAQVSAGIRTEFPIGFAIVEFLTHRPVTVLKAPPGDTTVASASYITATSSIGLPDAIVFAEQKDPDQVYYVVSHEMGHTFWLKHWENAPGSTPADHDKADHNCAMSYPTTSATYPHQRAGIYTPHFCGKCNLKLRGWDIDKAGFPADSS